MAKKMYYTEEEAAAKLGIKVPDLATYVRDSKLRVFQDGAKKMFRVDEVDALTGGGEDVVLAPGGGDKLSLEEAEASAPPTKEDTVITAEGISIFDDEDLEIEAADPMAKTQIAPSIEDQINLEGVGSGSGLLDLTRESDDTSLGAEVLDHIDIEEEGGAAGAPPAVGAPPVGAVHEVGGGGGGGAGATEVVMIAPSYVEAADAAAGLFGGIVVGACLVTALLAAVALTWFNIMPPEYVGYLKTKMSWVLVASVFVVLIGAGIGALVGKASAERQAAMKQMSV
jgi:hypothetical protein